MRRNQLPAPGKKQLSTQDLITVDAGAFSPGVPQVASRAAVQTDSFPDARIDMVAGVFVCGSRIKPYLSAARNVHRQTRYGLDSRRGDVLAGQ